MSGIGENLSGMAPELRREGQRARPLRVLFIGGTGVISAACVAEALRQGYEVHVLNRAVSHTRPLPPGVIAHTGDIRDAASTARALDGLDFDVVAEFVAFLPAHVRADVACFRDRTDQYIFVSSASAYQTPPARLPITESTPLRNPYWQYSRDKIACEEVLVAEYREHGFPATIVRPSHTYDRTGLPFDGRWTVVDRMRRGKPIIMPGDGTSLWTITHHTDVARGFVGLFGRSEAIGEAFHITGDEALTWNEITRQIARAAGVTELDMVHVPSVAIAAADPGWGAGLLGDKSHSMVFDNAKIRRLVPDFGNGNTVSFARGADEIIAWHDAHPEAQQVDPHYDRLMDLLADAYRPRPL